MFCKNCGKPLAGNEKFCKVCGQQIDPAATPFCNYPQFNNNTAFQQAKPTVTRSFKLDGASMVTLIAAIVIALTLFAANLFDLNCDCNEQNNTFSVSVFGENEIKGYHNEFSFSDNDEFEHDINTSLTISFIVIASLVTATIISLFMQRYNWMHAFSLLCFAVLIIFMYLSAAPVWVVFGASHSVTVTGGWILLIASLVMWIASSVKLVKSSGDKSTDNAENQSVNI